METVEYETTCDFCRETVRLVKQPNWFRFNDVGRTTYRHRFATANGDDWELQCKMLGPWATSRELTRQEIFGDDTG